MSVDTARPGIDAGVPRILLVAAIVAPGLVVFAIPMVSLIARNDEYFGGAYSAGRRVYVAGLLLVLAGVALWALRRTRVGRVAFVAYLLITPAYLVYALLAGAPRSIVLAALAIVVAVVAVLIARAGSSTSVRAVAIVSTVILVANGASAILETTAPPPEEIGAAGAPEAADGKTIPTAPPVEDRQSGESRPNVYHVILDEFQSDQFDVAARDQDRAALAGFTYFPEAVTPYGRTELAVADLFSQADYDFTVAPNAFVFQALINPSSSIQVLRAAGYDTTGHIPSRSLYGKTTPFDEVVLADDAARSDPGADYADLASSIWVDATAPDVVTKAIIPARHYDQLSNQALLPDDETTVAVQAFNSFLNREEGLAPTGRYTLVHLIVPHQPYVLDENCSTTPGVDTDGKAQARCALTLMDRFIAQLKELGRFDGSTIIIHGDHGAGLTRQGDELVAGNRDLYGPAWSTGRSRPLLLVKPAGTGASAPLATSDRPATTSDIMATVFDSVGLDVPLGPGRASLIGDDFPDRPVRYYHFYDKDAFGMPDGAVTRFTVTGDGLEKDRSVPVPSP